MGNSEAINFSKNVYEENDMDFMKQLCYIETRSLPYSGSVQIYRFKQPPYDYIMKHKRVFNNNDPSLQTYKQNLLIAANELKHKNIAQIHYYKVHSQFHMCGKHSEIQTYCNYYTISLNQVINKRRKDDIRFTSNEIWYVLRSLLQISVLLRKKKHNFGAYRTKNVTLSSEGYLKLYVFNFNKDSFSAEDYTQNQQYTIARNDRTNIFQYLPLPPQFLPSIKQGNDLFEFNTQKQDSFMIATIVLQMMIDEDVKKYYAFNAQTFCTYKHSSVLKDLSRLAEVYDKKYLIFLLEKMLCETPNNRISPTFALQFINDNRDQISIGGSLKMFQDDENQIKPKVSYRTSFDFQSNILKSIEPNVLQNKLTAYPINAMSKRPHNKSIGVSLTSSKQSAQTKDKSLSKSRVRKEALPRGNSLKNKLRLIKH